VVTWLECGVSLKQLSVRHLKEHGLDGKAYRVKYGIPRAQPLAAKDTTAKRKAIVQNSRPWERAPTFPRHRRRRNGSKPQEHEGKRQRERKARESIDPFI
jgi:hypothetical protein